MFIVKKILGARINVPEPEKHIAGTAITQGMALTLTGGKLVAATGTPTHIALGAAKADEEVACYAVLPAMHFEVPVTAAPTSLKEGDKVTIAEGIRTVGERAFAGCVSIKNIDLPKSVKYIGAYAFENCRELREIRLQGPLASHNADAYTGCYAKVVERR